MLGANTTLELHHIFPKAQLYAQGRSTAEVNALANLTFLTKETNLEILDKAPELYLPTYQAKQPGALESHWLPVEPALWQLANYADLPRQAPRAARCCRQRVLRATAGWSRAGKRGRRGSPACVVLQPLGSIASEAEEELLAATNRWIAEQGLPPGEFVYEVIDADSGEPMALLDLAWPEGLQAGLSEPVAFLLDEPAETLRVANQAGFRYFTDAADFRRYVECEVLAIR